ncbi:hypothetical protein LCGC14_1384960 [marine sediment metagenome]|uniref:Uncharacterized protein n=1 Tax=marine sediment metagenome TaxID=412755 RepID=A0A0F9KMH9_9ZZZZ
MNMSILKKYGAAFVIFMNGGMVFTNLSYLKYGSPNPLWSGSWWKVILHCAIAIYCAVWLVHTSRKRANAG